MVSASIATSCPTHSCATYSRFDPACSPPHTSSAAKTPNRATISPPSATLGGVALGGLMVARFGVFAALLVCGGLQAGSNLLYVAQLWVGHDVAMLALTIGAENLTGGMASAAFVAYLSGLCSRDFTATQYALLSSLATVGLNVLAASGGYFAERLGWVPFFVLSTLACLPSLLILVWIMNRPTVPRGAA